MMAHSFPLLRNTFAVFHTAHAGQTNIQQEDVIITFGYKKLLATGETRYIVRKPSNLQKNGLSFPQVPQAYGVHLHKLQSTAHRPPPFPLYRGTTIYC